MITDLLVSEMIDRSDIVLYTARGELWEFHSMVAPIAMVETLIVGIAKRNEEKFLKKLKDIHLLRKRYESFIPRL